MGIKEISRTQGDSFVSLMAMLVSLDLMTLEEFISVCLDLDEYVVNKDDSYWSNIFSIAANSR